MPRRPRRLPGIPSDTSFAKPVCSMGHDQRYLRKEPEGWVCTECVDHWLNEQKFKDTSRGGVILPAGALVPKQRSVTEVMPNRAARRRAR